MSTDDELLQGMKRPTGRGAVGLGLAAIVAPFVFSITRNGLDYVKAGAGAAAILLGLIAVIMAIRNPVGRAKNIGLTLLVFLGGAFHVVTSGALGYLNIDFGGGEDDARAWLMENGAEVISIERQDDHYAYRVFRDDQRCSGTLRIQSGFIGTSTSHVESCGGRPTDAELQQECGLAWPASCQEYGLRIVDSAPAEALEYFRRGCAGDIGGACTNAGVELRRLGNNAEAMAMAERACEMNDDVGCGNLGAYLLHTEGQTVTPEIATRAQALLERACTAESYGACGRLASDISFGDILPKNESRARTLFAQACEHGELASCADLGILLRDGRGGPEDRTAALSYVTRACAEGHFPLSCRMQGELLEEQGDGFNQAAVDAFTAACNQPGDSRHIGGACVQAGLHLFQRLDPKPFDRIVPLFARACELQDGDGCRNMGVVHRDGLLGAPNIAEAIRFFGLACSHGHQPSCGAAESLRGRL